MSDFEPGDYVNIENLEQPLIDALVARFKVDYVVTLSCLDFYDGEYQLGFHGGNWDLGTWYEACCNELTVEDVLFRGAPDWAVDVRWYDGDYYWTDGKEWRQRFSCEFKSVIGKVSNCKSIYSLNRGSEKTVADVVGHFDGKWPMEWNTTQIGWDGSNYTDGMDGTIICNFAEFDDYVKAQKEEYKNNWHERGEFPPVGVECEITCSEHGYTNGMILGRSEYNNELVIVTEKYGLTFHKQSHQFRPIQKPKKIDMSKFAWTSILMRSRRDNALFFDSCGGYMIDEDATPRLNYWNAVKNITEKPVWLDGFDVTVREVISNGEIIQHSSNYVISWSKVIAIRFDSVAEGWEL